MSQSTRDEHTTVIPNTCGARLIRCLVSVGDEDPSIETSVEKLPIVAFAIDANLSLTPLLLSGPVVGWGELRASVAGCYIYGLAADSIEGITTADSEYGSQEEFVRHSEALGILAVADVRREKGWPENLLPVVSETLE